MAPPPYPPAGEEEVRLRGGRPATVSTIRPRGAMLSGGALWPGCYYPQNFTACAPNGWQQGAGCPAAGRAGPSFTLARSLAPPLAPGQASGFRCARSGGRKLPHPFLAAPPAVASRRSEHPQVHGPWLTPCSAPSCLQLLDYEEADEEATAGEAAKEGAQVRSRSTLFNLLLLLVAVVCFTACALSLPACRR